ncbi:MAG: HlyD family efflux transporter periplasmic adaptor subunit, partial [Oscillospiraceae bacterium]
MEKIQNDTISEKPKKKKHLATKIIFFSLLSIPIIYLLFQMYSIYYRPYTTQTAIEVTLSDTIQATGIIGRNEAVLPSLESGVPLYVVDDGLRVSAGANVAEVYSDIYQVNSKEKIDILNKKIEDLQYAQNDGVVAGTDVDTVLKDLQTN